MLNVVETTIDNKHIDLILNGAGSHAPNRTTVHTDFAKYSNACLQEMKYLFRFILKQSEVRLPLGPTIASIIPQ